MRDNTDAAGEPQEQDPKARILAAASRLFLRGGVAALSVRAIAAEAGVSTIGIYSHFQGKQGILDTLYIEGFQRVSRAMDVPVNPDAPRDAVLAACRNYVDSAAESEAHYRLIFGERDDGYAPSEQAQTVGIEAFQHLVRLAGSLLPPGASLAERQGAAIQVWSVLHGFVSLQQHDVAQLVDMRAWKRSAIQTAAVVVDAICQQHSAESANA